jgi:hypothetical protein
LNACAGTLQQLMRCEGVEYLFEGSTAFAQRCAFSPVRLAQRVACLVSVLF